MKKKLFGIDPERETELWKTVAKIEKDLEKEPEKDYGTLYLNRLIDVYKTKFWTIEELVLISFATGKRVGINSVQEHMIENFIKDIK